jgi:penicillin V acylase-like amidase (Ntn superfamily)
MPRAEPFTIVAANAPNGRAATVHVSRSDPAGDSAILGYIGGKLQIHRGSECMVMTDSPVYDQQIAINAYWELIGGPAVWAATSPGSSPSGEPFKFLTP